ncbi:unnamed protein product [Auanema sp. JU1783]|nr:unnamed protein product [Auanema sp. JU1783]
MSKADETTEISDDEQPGTSKTVQEPVEETKPQLMSTEEILKFNKVCEDHHRRMILAENLFNATKSALKTIRLKQLAKKRGEVEACTSSDLKTRCSAVFGDYKNQLEMSTAERDLRTESMERKYLAESEIADFTEEDVTRLKEQAMKYNRLDTKLFEDALNEASKSMKKFLASEPHDISLIDFSAVREQLARHNCPPSVMAMCDPNNFAAITLRDVVEINDLVNTGCFIQ